MALLKELWGRGWWGAGGGLTCICIFLPPLSSSQNYAWKQCSCYCLTIAYHIHDYMWIWFIFLGWQTTVLACKDSWCSILLVEVLDLDSLPSSWKGCLLSMARNQNLDSPSILLPRFLSLLWISKIFNFNLLTVPVIYE